MRTIDVDQHLFEERNIWAEYIDPKHKDDALAIVDDENGWAWVTWKGEKLYPAEIQQPGEAAEIGDARRAMERGEKAPGSYDELLPDSYSKARARLEVLDEFDIDKAVLFPNFGLVWEGMLAKDPAAQRANLRAYNRWMAENLSDGDGRLYGVAQLGLQDTTWVKEELSRLANDGIKLAMIAPAPVDGKPLSDPELDPVWQAFCDNGITPVFHVAGFPSPLDSAWLKNDPEQVDQYFDSIFLGVAPALALADMITHGVFERFSDLHVAVVELTAGWVPAYLLQIDGAFDFYTLRHTGPPYPLTRKPSEFFRDHVRVCALPYENPAMLARQAGADLFMVGSDWPHAEGVRDPGVSSRRVVADLSEHDQGLILADNIGALLGV